MTRIKELLKSRGLTHQKVADALGVSRQAVQKWAAGEPPTLANLQKLAGYLHVSVSSLTDGVAVAADGEPRDGWTRIPHLSVEASCGGGAGEQPVAIVGSIDIFTAFLRSLPGVTSVDKIDLINAHGDSMEPTISDQNVCIVDRNQNVIRQDAVFCLQAHGDLFIKRIRRNLDGTITMISDNSLYPPERVDRATLESAEIIGRVIYVFNGKEL